MLTRHRWWFLDSLQLYLSTSLACEVASMSFRNSLHRHTIFLSSCHLLQQAHCILVFVIRYCSSIYFFLMSFFWRSQIFSYVFLLRVRISHTFWGWFLSHMSKFFPLIYEEKNYIPYISAFACFFEQKKHPRRNLQGCFNWTDH